MPVPTSITDLDPTAANNSPAGSDSIGTSLDDYLRSHAAIIKQVDSAKLNIAGGTMTGALKNTHSQIGTSSTASNNFSLEPTTTGAMKLARGNSGSTTQDIITVDSNGKIAFPAQGQSLATNGYSFLPGGILVQWGTNAIVVNSGGDGDINYSPTFTSLFTIIVSDGDGVTNIGVVNSSILSKFTFRSETPSIAVRCNWIAIGT